MNVSTAVIFVIVIFVVVAMLTLRRSTEHRTAYADFRWRHAESLVDRRGSLQPSVSGGRRVPRGDGGGKERYRLRQLMMLMLLLLLLMLDLLVMQEMILLTRRQRWRTIRVAMVTSTGIGVVLDAQATVSGARNDAVELLSVRGVMRKMV